MFVPIRTASAIVLALVLAAVASAPARAEVLEEIVARVNGDIITKSELDNEETAMMTEMYRRFDGAELDRRVELFRKRLLMELIERRMLYQFAKRAYDIERLGAALYDSFKESQMEQLNLESKEEFEAALRREGMTPDDLKQRLLLTYAPDEVLRYEVRSRVAVSEPEMRTFYEENSEEFRVEETVTLSEIVLLADTEATREQRRAEAAAILERARVEDFAELAKSVSESGTKDAGGDLGTVSRGDLSTALEEAAFAMQTGDVSELLEMPYGFHILKVEAHEGGEIQSFEVVQDRLRTGMEDFRYQEDAEAFMLTVRAEADWCVQPKYSDRIPEDADAEICGAM